MEQLASLSGVSRSMLSQIERGSANPTLGIAFRIAQAFGLSLGDLVDSSSPATRIDVIRSDDHNYLFRDDENCRIRTLSPLHLEKETEFYELLLKPSGQLESSPHFEGAREFLTVQKGQLKLTAGDEVSELGRGDSAHYPADVTHKIENIGRGEASRSNTYRVPTVHTSPRPHPYPRCSRQLRNGGQTSRQQTSPR